MKKEYTSPEFEIYRVVLNYSVLGDSIPEVPKEDGEIIDNEWGNW